MSYTYIMSGISMVLKDGATEKRHNEHYSNMVKDTMAEYKSFLNLELMFNAYQEDKLMENYLSKYNSFGAVWHADSGGLQMVTQGKTLTEELKDIIYEMQAKHSDYAMCFDALPLKGYPNLSLTCQYNEKTGNLDVQDPWVRGPSSRTDLDYRSYIVEWNERCARVTGRNVKRQIEVIRKNNSKTKVFLICQGNKTQDFVDYYNWAIDEIDEIDYPYIAGIALATACCGLGPRENLKMLGSYPYMDIPKGMGNKLHLLGFGSVVRVKRALVLYENWIDIDIDITFDSSSHAMNVLTGTIEFESGKELYGQNRNKIKEKNHEWLRNPHADKILERLYNKYEPIFTRYYPDMSIDKFLEITGYDFETSRRFHEIISPPEMIEKYNIDLKTSTTIHLYKRFLDAFESFLTFSVKMEKTLNSKEGDQDIDNLRNITSIKDYEEFMSDPHKIKNFKSKRIKRYPKEAEADKANRGVFGDQGKGHHIKKPKTKKNNFRAQLPGT